MGECEAWEKLVVILLNEMYMCEDLVFEKQTGKLIGFTSLGSVNDHLLSFEKSVTNGTENDPVNALAKTMMVFMVRGLFSCLCYPYAQFPCCAVTGKLLYHPFWEAEYRLERMQFKVHCRCDLCFIVYTF